MKNREIIANAAVEAGVLTRMEADTALRNSWDIPFHTLQGWNLRGDYRVKEGEVGYEVRIWKKMKNEDRFYLAKAYFYTKAQLELVTR